MKLNKMLPLLIIGSIFSILIYVGVKSLYCFGRKIGEKYEVVNGKVVSIDIEERLDHSNNDKFRKYKKVYIPIFEYSYNGVKYKEKSIIEYGKREVEKKGYKIGENIELRVYPSYPESPLPNTLYSTYFELIRGVISLILSFFIGFIFLKKFSW